MGVNGLWKLLEASGKPVPVETLENKVLAVDVSIWLHQLTKGTHDLAGGSVPNAHLIGLYHRICKLLFFKIKPVFVFDGGVPQLKKQTIAQRKTLKSKAASNADKVRSDLLKNLLEQQLLNDVLGKNEMALPPPSVSREVDMFDSDDTEAKFRYADLHSVDINSEQFSALPPDMRHEILTELLEQRKLSSWHKMHEMPQESDNFSSYQMERLLKRRAIQKKLDETAGELGEHVMSLGELESMFIKEGVLARRVASNANERVIYQTKDSKDSSSSSQSEVLDRRKEDNIIDAEEKDILEMIRAEEENEIEFEEEIAGGKEEKTEKIKLTREMLAEQQKILDSLVKKKAKSDDVIDVDLTETSTSGDFMFDESEMLEQNQILASIQQRLNPDLASDQSTTSSNLAKSIEITIDPSKPLGTNTDDIFSDVFATVVNSSQLETIASKASTAVPNATKEPKLDKVIEITIDPNKIKEASSDVDIFSDVFNNDNKVETIENEDVLMSDTSSESSDDTPVVVNGNSEVNNTDTTPVDSNKIDPANSETIANTKLDDSLEKEIFDDVDEADGGEDEIMSDDSESSVEDLTKVCEFISETQASKTDQANNQNVGNIDKVLSDSKNVHADNHVDKTGIIPEDTANISSQTNKTFDNSLKQLNEDTPLPTSSNVAFSSSSSSSSSNSASTSNAVSTSNVASTSNAASTSLTASTSNATVSSIASTSVAVSTIKQILSSNQTPEGPSSEINSSKSDVSKAFDTQPSSSGQSKKESYFKNTLNEMQTKKLLEYQSTLEKDRDQLLLERGKQTRLASTITEQMSREAQELLQLFGVPFIVAPGEAEAQCASLELGNHTQGVITDDSDIWLFGARTVYKNFFDKKSHVLRYTAPDIRYYFELTREKLIQLALLVGSDYTPGLQGVGPVTALEILAKFSPSDSPNQNYIVESMRRFKNWLAKKNKPDTHLTRKLRNVKLNDDFPNVSVIEAYLKPDINTNVQKLAWGTPDLDGLRRFAANKFGWSQNRVDQTLIPIMKKISQRSDQPTLDMFYKNKVVIPKRPNAVSKRVRTAVDKSKSKRLKEEVSLSESDSD
ncbi:hypothetical protein M8J75_009396 [Diaphorina citri]|nr:hypothetical protein M8J75_009396 [Diaphorina citri]